MKDESCKWGMDANSDYLVDTGISFSKINYPSITGVRSFEFVVLSLIPPIYYAANYGLQYEFEFVGDFVCQDPQRDEKVDIMRTIVARCFEKYRENCKAQPKKIVIFQNGCGEGQFPTTCLPVIIVCYG